MSIDVMLGWQATVSDDFKTHAACRGMDPEFFMPSVGKHGREAKQVCNGRPATRNAPAIAPCPVKQQCLDYCFSLPGPVVGIWGGTTERERRFIKREQPVTVRARFHHGTEHGYRLHLKQGTKACDSCRQAHSQFNQAWRDRAKDRETMPALSELVNIITEVHRNAPSRPAE